jgi:hypothetical protein
MRTNFIIWKYIFQDYVVGVNIDESYWEDRMGDTRLKLT